MFIKICRIFLETKSNIKDNIQKYWLSHIIISNQLK